MAEKVLRSSTFGRRNRIQGVLAENVLC